MSVELGINPNEAYQQEQLERFEEGIAQARTSLEAVYTGDHRASDEKYATMSERFLRISARRLFEMQLFQLPEVLKGNWDERTPEEKDQIIGKPLLKFEGFSGTILFLDLDGKIFEKHGSKDIYDGEVHLIKDVLNPIPPETYRETATYALDALLSRARSNADKIAPMRPFRGWRLLDLEEDLRVEFPKDFPEAA